MIKSCRPSSRPAAGRVPLVQGSSLCIMPGLRACTKPVYTMQAKFHFGGRARALIQSDPGKSADVQC